MHKYHHTSFPAIRALYLPWTLSSLATSLLAQARNALSASAFKKGEVLVRVHYSGLNNFDRENASENRNSAMAKALKKSAVISGIEMSGLAESDGVTEFIQNTGLCTLIPSEDAVIATKLHQQMIDLKYWYITLSASDANRNAISIARTITG